jgi:hypothetical protein
MNRFRTFARNRQNGFVALGNCFVKVSLLAGAHQARAWSELSMGSKRNSWDPAPLALQSRDKRDRHDEINDFIWCRCLAAPIRSCQSGIGAARHYQSGQVRPVLSELKLPELWAG